MTSTFRYWNSDAIKSLQSFCGLEKHYSAGAAESRSLLKIKPDNIDICAITENSTQAFKKFLTKTL